MPDLSGYRGPSAKLLNEAGASIGDVIEVQMGAEKVKGTLVPRYEHNDDSHIVIKLKSGYNVGISVGKVSKVVRLEKGEAPKFVAPKLAGARDLPEVSILGTGGTIASRVDYRTGAVRPATTSEELYSLFPELSEVASIKPEIVVSVYSENLEPGHWEAIAKRASEVVARGVSGIILTMGTDTMGYTAAALSFALKGLPVPLFIVGSQRSSDRPSSDAFLNLIGAATMAVQADLSGVYVVMHADSSDERLSVHLGTRVRKNHTSARDAFESMGVEPVATGRGRGRRYCLTKRHLREVRRKASRRGQSSTRAWRWSSSSRPCRKSTSLRFLTSGMKGVVFEGTGLGHINSKNIDLVKKFVDEGGVACMTSQCLWGRVDMNVYDTGRDLLKAGVITLGRYAPGDGASEAHVGSRQLQDAPRGQDRHAREPLRRDDEPDHPKEVALTWRRNLETHRCLSIPMPAI